jgi:hypothetical protein
MKQLILQSSAAGYAPSMISLPNSHSLHLLHCSSNIALCIFFAFPLLRLHACIIFLFNRSSVCRVVLYLFCIALHSSHFYLLWFCMIVVAVHNILLLMQFEIQNIQHSTHHQLLVRSTTTSPLIASLAHDVCSASSTSSSLCESGC